MLTQRTSTSLKAALDQDWDQPEARDHALRVVLKALEGIEALVAAQPPRAQDLFVRANLAVARQVREQDVVENAEGQPTIGQGVAEDRRISVEDPDMRHGRKTRSLRIDGYKRHVLTELDSDLVRGCGMTPANLPDGVGEPVPKEVARSSIPSPAPNRTRLLTNPDWSLWSTSRLLTRRPAGIDAVGSHHLRSVAAADAVVALPAVCYASTVSVTATSINVAHNTAPQKGE